MRILIAPDSFKETLTANDAAEAMARGATAALPNARIDRCPIADGGEGTVEALVAATDGRCVVASVTGPRGTPIDAAYGLLGDGRTAVIELAAASGIALLPAAHRDPEHTTTFGTGELIRHAIEGGADAILVGLGGSATCDGAAGLVQALGGRFLDDDGNAVARPITGGDLERVSAFDGTAMIALPPVTVACDVSNPLCGPRGSAAVYGPQKGATPEQVRMLDAALARYAELVSLDPETPGSGSAGGSGFGLMAFCGARLVPGIELVLDAVGFAPRAAAADLVLTGEGRLDEQSLAGKATVGVARAARDAGARVAAIAGACQPGAELAALFDRIESLADRFGSERAMAEAAACVQEASRSVVAAMAVG